MIARFLVASAIAAVMVVAPAPPSAAAAEPLATCFWEGPISMKRPSSRGFDGHFFNFPEKAATYWMARFRLPADAHLELAGTYAHGRYESLNAYSDGVPTDALADVAIAPDPGSVNPFLPGARRDGTRRAFTVRVLDEAPPEGTRAPNTLYARPEGDVPIEVFLRVYEPDRGYDLDGGGGLPVPTLRLGDGSARTGEELCGQINDPDRSIPTQTVAPELWTAARNAPGCDGRTNPAYDPVRWERFFNIDYASQAVITDCTGAGRSVRRSNPPEPRGGFYSNRDNAYVYAHLSRKFGELLVVTARLPTVPRTYERQRTMQTGELRYWSLCSGESRVTTRTPDCVSDREVPVDRQRTFTAVISRAADRPANATLACGVAWIDWGERGDGTGDPDYASLILRNMLPADSFAQAIQRVPRPGAEEQVMGPQFPKTAYSSKQEFEKRGCTGSAIAILPGPVRHGVRLRCTSYEATCTGRVRLALPGGRSAGKARFTIATGEPRRVTVRVPRRARGRRVTARVTATTPVGVPLTARRVLRVR